VLALCCLLPVLAFTSGCGSESAKWKQARAKNLYLSGGLRSAIAELEAAHELSPEDESIMLLLAQLYAENGQCELGIGLCNEYLKQHPDDIKGYDTRSTCWRFLGRFDRALADYKKSLGNNVSRSPGELNNLAYFRGLANKEIDRAVEDIQKAITKVETGQWQTWGSPLILPLQVRTLISAGLISRHIDRHQEAIDHLSRKIAQYDESLKRRRENLKEAITLESQFEFPFGKSTENALLNSRGNIEVQKVSLAAMLTTRALIHEDLGNHEQADRDRLRIRDLELEFSEMVKKLPSDFACLGSLEIASTYLDTRGFVLGRQSWSESSSKSAKLVGVLNSDLLFSSYQEALSDLDLAVLSSQFSQQALESSLYNTPEFSGEQIQRRKKYAARTTAVLLHHRKEVHLRGGNEEAAAKDQDRINSLGFKDSSLF